MKIIGHGGDGVLSAVVATTTVVLSCGAVFGVLLPPLPSFVATSALLLALTSWISRLFTESAKWRRFYIQAYLLHVILGLAHFLVFIDMDYFSRPEVQLPLPPDYTGCLDSVKKIVNTKHQNGLFTHTEVDVEHGFLWNLISYLFYIFGPHIINIAPVNSFLTGLTSMIMVSMHGGFDSPGRHSGNTAFFTTYFPLLLISSIFWRDTFGLLILTLAVWLVHKTKGRRYFFLATLVGAVLASTHRTIYAGVFALAALVWLFQKRGANRTLITNTMIFLIPILIFAGKQMAEVLLFTLDDNKTYFQLLQNQNTSALPLKVVAGLIGPFPWGQYFIHGSHVMSYQFQDNIQACLNLALVVVCFRKLRRGRKQSGLEVVSFSTTLGVFLMIVALISPHMHMTYVACGVFFLMPFMTANATLREIVFLLITFAFVLFLLSSLSIGVGSFGIGSTWKT